MPLICDDATVSSVLTAVCAALLLAASAIGRAPLMVVLLVVQLVLIAGWFALAGLTTRWLGAGALVAAAGAAAADVALLRSHDHADVRAIAGVLAALVGCAFVTQLARRDGRARLTEALTATVASGALAVAGAILLGVRGGRSGVDVVAIALVAAGVGVLIVQRAVPLWASLPVGLCAGTGVGVLVARHASTVGSGSAAAIGAVSAAVALATRAATLAFTPVTDSDPSPDARSGTQVRAGGQLAVRSVASTLPIVVVAPAVLVVARVMVG